MITITPIYERDGDRLYRLFLRHEYLTQRLGRPGQWHGGGVSRLGLAGPIDPDVFKSLLHGRSPQGEALLPPSVLHPDRILGWRIHLTAAGPLNTLWALSAGSVRGRLQVDHAHAGRTAAADLENSFNRPAWWNPAHGQPSRSLLLARFQTGASSRQTPRLETTFFLFNLLFEKGKENQQLNPDRVLAQQRRLHSVFAGTLTASLLRVLGGRVHLPAALSLRFEGHPPAELADSRGVRPNQPLQNAELFAAWQAQAQSWGWGPARIRQMMLEARPTWSNLIQDCKTLGRLWSIWTRHPEHSVVRVSYTLSVSREQRRSQQSKSRDRDKGISH